MIERKLHREEIANPEEIPLLEDLECSIDMMISLNPYICKKCETIFCQSCVTLWKNKSQECPMRCKPFEYSLLKNSIMNTLINNIKLYCCNKNYGCDFICLIDEKEKHEKNCEYQLIECSKCKLFITKKILIDHFFKKCEKMKINCFLCNQYFNLYNFISHYEDCLKTIKNCEFCFEKINLQKEDSIIKHFENCENKIEICKECNIPEFSKIIKSRHSHINDLNQKEEIISNHLKLIIYPKLQKMNY